MGYEVKANKRDVKENITQLRRAGKIPGVIYGHKENTKHIVVDGETLKDLLSALHSESTLINVRYGKEKLECVIKEVQRDILTNRIIHIDFHHIHRGEKITINVPIVLEGSSNGVKEGGVLDFVTREVEIECLPKDIIDEIKVDVSNVDIGDTVHIRDIDIDREKYKILENPSEPVFSIVIPKVAVVEEEEEVEVSPEPELIGKEEEEKEKEKSEKGA